MATSYTKTNWQDAPSTATPITAAQLNRMEKGIEDCSGQGNANELAIAANGAAIQAIATDKQDKFASVSHPDPNGNVSWLNIDTPVLNVHNSNHKSSLTMDDNGVELTNVSGLAKLNVNQNNIKCSKSSGAIPVLGVATPVTATDTSKNITESDLPYQAVNKKYVDDTTNNVKSYVNNNFANALKGSASGEAVRLNDVSPIEHEIKIKLTTESNYSVFSGVTLKRYGKNLLPYPYKNTNIDHTANGINYKVKSDGTVVANGTATAQSYFILAEPVVLNKGVYYLSGCPSGGQGSTYHIYFQYDNFSYYKVDYGSGVKIELNGKKNCNVVINIGKNTTVSNLIFKPMLEVGSKSTDFEERRAAVAYTPAADGTVTGVTSISPNMTFLSDTDGVIINAEYNRDINKAFAALEAAIVANNS